MTRAEPKTWDEALDAVLAEMREIMITRQAKYGPQNIIDQGLYGVIVRGAADKVARIQNALNGKVVKGKIELDPILDGTDENDTFEDGLLDASNYFGPIALMVKRGWWTLPRDYGQRLAESDTVSVLTKTASAAGMYAEELGDFLVQLLVEGSPAYTGPSVMVDCGDCGQKYPYLHECSVDMAADPHGPRCSCLDCCAFDETAGMYTD